MRQPPRRLAVTDKSARQFLYGATATGRCLLKTHRQYRLYEHRFQDHIRGVAGCSDHQKPTFAIVETNAALLRAPTTPQQAM
jgi:hypothetical protein